MPASESQMIIEGLQEAQNALWKNNAIPEDKEIFLFSNDATISDALTNTDLTEITDGGVAKQTLAKENFADATAADPVVTVYNPGSGVTWTTTILKTIYGWAVRGVTSGKLYAARNWGALTVPAGFPVTVNPVQFASNIPEPE